MINDERNSLRLMQTYWFVFGLVLLLLNDFILKEVFGNWFTGKLSDFTGLFIFQLFWISFFPKYKKPILFSVCVLFIFWKSSLSGGFIHLWNNSAPFLINRTIDYTDLIALIVLPFANSLEKERDQLRTVAIHPALPFVVSSFAFMATSYDSRIEYSATYEFNYGIEKLYSKINAIPDTDIFKRRHFQKGEKDSTNQSFIIPNEIDSSLIIIDTTYVNIKEDFCFHGYKTKVIVSGNNRKSKLTILEFQHDCPTNEGGKDDLKILKESFLKKVIQPLLEK
jgi:hypothetical protein